MADRFNKSKRSQIMAAVRSRGNKATEMKLVQILRKSRINGWRRNRRLIGNPDFTFPQFKLAVFVDGCFWHGCRKHLRMPSENREYWLQKIEGNAKRDKATIRILRGAGWRTLRIWEHELKVSHRVVQRLIKALRGTLKRVQIQRRQKRSS